MPSNVAPPQKIKANVSVVFGAECEDLLIREINGAKNEILVAIYSITRRNITGALARAAKRGAQVSVKYDAGQLESQGMKQAVAYLSSHGVLCLPIRRQGEYARMHHKFTVIDKTVVLTGSYNYTTTASTSNDENLVLIESPATALVFADEFEKITNR